MKKQLDSPIWMSSGTLSSILDIVDSVSLPGSDAFCGRHSQAVQLLLPHAASQIGPNEF